MILLSGSLAELCSGRLIWISPRGQCSLLGANGSGKYFIKALLGVVSPLSGKFIWPHQNPHAIAYLGQRTEFDQLFPLRVRDLIAMGKWRGARFWSRSWAHSDELLDAAKRVDLEGVLNEPCILSGGQLQRTFCPRHYADAPFVVLDEPFAAIDQKTERLLQELILEWREEGRTVVLAVHDLSIVLRHLMLLCCWERIAHMVLRKC